MKEVGIIAHVDFGVIGHTSYELVYAQLETAQIIVLECKDINHQEVAKRELPIMQIKIQEFFTPEKVILYQARHRRVHPKNCSVQTNMHLSRHNVRRLQYGYMHQKKL
ncbi:hypothetical protein IPF86_00925 [Candidatus Nomurabacteria bacterium]|jgi:hypothetical protein|nr:MAG: hypothetical protein IPF86_00925 [Candidatus Nomurabacteria bacterium]